MARHEHLPIYKKAMDIDNLLVSWIILTSKFNIISFGNPSEKANEVFENVVIMHPPFR